MCLVISDALTVVHATVEGEVDAEGQEPHGGEPWAPRTQVVKHAYAKQLWDLAIRDEAEANGWIYVDPTDEIAMPLLADPDRLRFAQRNLRFAEEGRELSAENLRLSQKAFDLGELDLPRLLHARIRAFEAELDAMLHLHGAIFTAWVLLGIVQPALIAGGNYRLHRRVGVGGAVAAAAMVAVGNLVAVASMNWPAIAPGDPFAFYAIPFFAINTFAVLVALGIANRRRPETHKRLMLLAATQIVEAAVARVPLPIITDYFPVSHLVASNLIIVAGVAYDLASRGRVHPVWLWGGAIVLASQAARLAVAETAPWLAFARFMAGLY